MSDKTVKIVGRHIKGCAAVRLAKSGEWDTCWGPLAYGDRGDPVIVTERRYGKKGRVFKHWLRYLCNDSDCSAELHICADDLPSMLAAREQGKGER